MRKDEITVLEIKENKEIDILNVPLEENRIKDDNVKIDATFETAKNIFSASLMKRGFIARILRRKGKRFDCLIHRAGSNHCIELAENDLIDPLTNEEAKEIVKRNMALGMAKFEPISTKIAMIIIILLIIACILGILNLAGVRIR